MPEKQADAELQLDIDVMILDYLMYMATRTLLNEANAQMRCKQDGIVEETAKSHQRHSPSVAVDRSRTEASNDAAADYVEPDLAISMVDSFLHSFQLRHPSAGVAMSLKLRLKLLRLTCLFTHRLSRCRSTPSREALEGLRLKNRKRAERFNQSLTIEATRTSRKRNRDGDLVSTSASTSAASVATNSAIMHSISSAFAQELPIPQESVERNRESVMKTLQVTVSVTSPSPSESPSLSLSSSSSTSPSAAPSNTSVPSKSTSFYGTPDSVSLLDLLPFFISLSAARAHLGPGAEQFVAQPRWMHLAAEWMLQAVLEQYRVFGAEGSGSVEESFAWGYCGESCRGANNERGTTTEDGDAGERKTDGEEEEESLVNALFARDAEGNKEDDVTGDGVTLVENETWTRTKREYMQKVSAFCSQDSPFRQFQS